MLSILTKVSIRVNENIYLKDPESSELGHKIIQSSIDLIDELGFEAFTFRKLSQEIGSTEASVYRYFESKHKLLLYITAWYWGWMEYQLAFGMANIDDPWLRLDRALKLITQKVVEDQSFYINESKLHRIVISESSKAYLTKEVDQENQDGFFMGYKQLVSRISAIIQEINPDYKYPHMLVSTVIEGAHHLHYFSEHLPRLTDIIIGEDAVSDFYTDLVKKAILT